MEIKQALVSYRRKQLSFRRSLAFTIAIIIMLTFVSMFVGRYPTPGFAFGNDELLQSIIIEIRLPRIIMAIMGGAMLGAAGFTFQLLFANPLVEPGFLGISQGASFGAALVIVTLGYVPLLVQASATVFGISALIISYRLARIFRFGGWILRLILSGIAVGAFFSSGLSIIKLAAEPSSSLQDITFWLMGGLYNSTWSNIYYVIPIVLVVLLILIAVRWRLNVLSLDDRIAHSLGTSASKEKLVLLFLATVGTTTVVSVSGIVGWIGLIVPHIARRFFGTDARYSLLGSMCIGSLFMLLCDTIARTLFSGEIPLGVLTSLLGTIVFIILLSGKRTGAWL